MTREEKIIGEYKTEHKHRIRCVRVFEHGNIIIYKEKNTFGSVWDVIDSFNLPLSKLKEIVKHFEKKDECIQDLEDLENELQKGPNK